MTEQNRAYHGDVGRAFAARAGSYGLNSLHERPAVIELVGDVEGLDVADLGCGAGQLAALLSGAGARVTGVDGSRVLVEIAASFGRVGGSCSQPRIPRPTGDTSAARTSTNAG